MAGAGIPFGVGGFGISAVSGVLPLIGAGMPFAAGTFGLVIVSENIRIDPDLYLIAPGTIRALKAFKRPS